MSETPEDVTATPPEPPPVEAPAVHAPPKPKRHYRKHRRGIRRGPYAVRQAGTSAPAAPAAGGPPPAAGSLANGRAAHEAFLAAQEEYRDAVGDDSDEAAR